MKNHDKIKPIVLYLFSENVNSVDDPAVREFREILDRISLSYGSRLVHFSVDRGAVTFQFDRSKVMHDIMKDIVDTIGFREDYKLKPAYAGCGQAERCPPMHRRRA